MAERSCLGCGHSEASFDAFFETCGYWREDKGLCRHKCDYPNVRKVDAGCDTCAHVFPNGQEIHFAECAKLTREFTLHLMERHAQLAELVQLQRKCLVGWVACGMNETIPCDVTLTFTTPDEAYACYLGLKASDKNETK